MSLQVLFHGNCFDGAASAAIFSRFYRQRIHALSPVAYRPLAHRRGDPFGPDHGVCFFAPVNAVLDFRYSSSERLNWYCDHHQSAFLSEFDQRQFEQEKHPQKRYDPTAPSCAGLLTRWLVAHHGFDPSGLEELVAWADLIDSAQFKSPKQAVELVEAPLQLMAVLEIASEALNCRIAEQLALSPLGEVHADPAVQAALGPVLEQHHRTIAVMRSRMRVTQGVAFFDLSADRLESFNKFIPYYLADDVRYTVGISLSSTRAKLSVGSNPWRRPVPLVNLAEVCQRYGGGGHAVVAAASFPPAELAAAQRAAGEVVALLRGS
jgi:hypothetical protein